MLLQKKLLLAALLGISAIFIFYACKTQKPAALPDANVVNPLLPESLPYKRWALKIIFWLILLLMPAILLTIA
jgi:hypothetical protein